MAIPEVFPHKCAQLLVKARYGRFGPERQPIEQIAAFPFAEDARAADSPQMKQRIGIRKSPRQHLQHPHFGCAEPGHAGGQLFEKFARAGLSSGKALRLLESRSKQASGVGEQYACQLRLAVFNSVSVTDKSNASSLRNSSARTPSKSKSTRRKTSFAAICG